MKKTTTVKKAPKKAAKKVAKKPTTHAKKPVTRGPQTATKKQLELYEQLLEKTPKPLQTLADAVDNSYKGTLALLLRMRDKGFAKDVDRRGWIRGDKKPT